MVVFVRVAERVQSHKPITMIVVGETMLAISLHAATTMITLAIPVVDTQTVPIIIAVGVIKVEEPVLPGILLDRVPAVHLEVVDSPVEVVEMLGVVGVLVAVVVVIHAEGTNLKTIFV